MMKSIFLAPTLLLAAGRLIAQQPAVPAAAAKVPVRLDAIVAVVGDQAITRYDLSEAVLTKIQRREVEEPKDSAASVALDSTHPRRYDPGRVDHPEGEGSQDRSARRRRFATGRSSGEGRARGIRQRRTVPFRVAEGRARIAGGISQVPHGAVPTTAPARQGHPQASAGRQDRQRQRQRSRDLGRVRPREGVPAQEARVGHVQADHHRAAADRGREGSGARQSGVIARATQVGRRFREDGEARVDGSRDQGDRRRPRVDPSRHAAAGVRALAVGHAVHFGNAARVS